jgi:uncharacterized protein (DUF1778 family)
MAKSARGTRSTRGELKEERIERMALVGADQEIFLQAVLAPPEPNEKLIAALKRHRVMFPEIGRR